MQFIDHKGVSLHEARAYAATYLPPYSRPGGRVASYSTRTAATDLHANSPERRLIPHRERVELRTGIAKIGGTHLFGDIAMKVVEHESHVAIDVPVQRRRIDGLSSTGDAVGQGELIVEIDSADTTGNFPCAPAAAGQ